MAVSRRAVIAAGLAAIPVCALSAYGQESSGSGAAGAGAGAAGSDRATGRDATGSTGGSTGASPGGRMDAALATMLMIDGYKQIEISRFAAERAQSDAVKAFATAEVKEHESLKATLQGKGQRPLVAIGQGSEAGGQAKAPAGQPEPQPAAAGIAGSGRGASDVLQVKNEIATLCVSTTKQQLEAMQGAELDKMYVNQQLIAHLDLLDSAQVFKRHGSEDMRATLLQAQPVIEQHIATLKQLKSQLEGKPVPNR